MPWTLVYPTTEAKVAEHDVGVLQASPDVESVTTTTRDSSLEIIVRFHDELERTDDPELVRIHLAWRIGLPTRREWTDGPAPQPTPLTDLDREALISRALATQEGRSRLAAAMAAPLRRNLNYASIARSVFQVEQMPEGALPTYEVHREPTGEPVGVNILAPIAGPLGNDQVGDAASHDITAWRPIGAPIVPFGALASGGTGATIVQTEGGMALVGGLMGMLPSAVGHYLRLSGATNPANNGTYQITSVVDSSLVWISNPHAWPEHFPRIGWEEFYPPSPLGGLDQFQTVDTHVMAATNPWGASGPGGFSRYETLTGFDLPGAVGIFSALSEGLEQIIETAPQGPTGLAVPVPNPREALRQALERARVLRPNDSVLERVIQDFEAIQGRPLEMRDVPNLAEDRALVPPKPTGWERLLGDSLLADD